ncbi:MAG: hypothetical protein ACI9DE_002112, partial [Halioglobus sp.]
MGSGPFRNSVDGGGGGIVAGTPGVARLVAGRNPQRTKAVVGHAISKHVVESMQRLFEAWRQRARRNATTSEAALTTLNDVDVFVVHIDPKPARRCNGICITITITIT